MMKKLAITIAAAAMSLMAVTGVSANTTKYVANEIGVNVRQSATASSTRLGGLYQGDAVDVIADQNNGWSKINYNGKVAYVISECLSYSKPVVQNASAAGMHDADQTWITFTNSSNTSQIKAERGEMSHDNDTFTVYVESGYLALRSSAYSSADNIIGELYNGYYVHVKSYGTQFDYVYSPTLGMYGYVNNDYLR